MYDADEFDPNPDNIKIEVIFANDFVCELGELDPAAIFLIYDYVMTPI